MHYIIRPIIVYNDTKRPTSSISSIKGKNSAELLSNHEAYIGAKFFNNDTSITITGTAGDWEDDQKTIAGSGVKKVRLT